VGVGCVFNILALHSGGGISHLTDLYGFVAFHLL
jgi:hypothetical protein